MNFIVDAQAICVLALGISDKSLRLPFRVEGADAPERIFTMSF
jgi:hypothetical protein